MAIDKVIQVTLNPYILRENIAQVPLRSYKWTLHKDFHILIGAGMENCMLEFLIKIGIFPLHKNNIYKARVEIMYFFMKLKNWNSLPIACNVTIVSRFKVKIPHI